MNQGSFEPLAQLFVISRRWRMGPDMGPDKRILRKLAAPRKLNADVAGCIMCDAVKNQSCVPG